MGLYSLNGSMPTFNGMPMVGNQVLPFTTGRYWFVSSVTGSNGNRDGSIKRPLATLEKAMSLCAVNDVIVLMPGHAETITGAGGITIDVAGVHVVGLGRYDYRPRFLMDGGATVTCLVTAANCSLENCVFAAGHSDIVTFATVTAAGFRLANNHFERNKADENFVSIVNTGTVDNGADGLEIIGNVMDFGGDAGELTPITLSKDSKDVKIINNRIYGDFDTTPYAAIYSANTEHHMAIEIAYNFIHNLHDANAVVGISVGSTTSTGEMHHNRVYALDVAGGTPFVSAATGIALFENYYTHVGGTTQGYYAPAQGTLA